jgi:predicted metal-dependent phosphoesterase TrpH
LEPEIICTGKLDAMPSFLFLGQGEQQAQEGREVLLNVAHDHVAQLGVVPDAFDPLVERAEGDDDLGTRIV